MNGQTPPGWYPDPYGNPGLQRWFDGTQWTQATQPTGPSAPPSWQPQAGGTPQPWQPPAEGTPPPWQPPAGGPGTPGPWSPGQPVPGPPRQNNRNLLMVLGGAGVLIVIIVLVAVLVSVVSDGGDPDPIARPTPSAPAQSPVISPVNGTITDSKSGLSWPQLGGEWTDPSDPTGDDEVGLHLGQTAVAQTAYNGVGDYVASVYGGVLPESVPFEGGAGADLEDVAKAWFEKIEPEYYPEHELTYGDSRASSVSGKKAWYFEVLLKFPQAKTEGWEFNQERVVIVVVDRPGSRPGGVYVSIPDNFASQGDAETVINGLKSS
ncbi:hypothetical protein GCM10022221_37940 [Actinocorallia aurea]